MELVGVTRVAETRRSFHGQVAAGLWGPVGGGVGVVQGVDSADVLAVARSCLWKRVLARVGALAALIIVSGCSRSLIGQRLFRICVGALHLLFA